MGGSCFILLQVHLSWMQTLKSVDSSMADIDPTNTFNFARAELHATVSEAMLIRALINDKLEPATRKRRIKQEFDSAKRMKTMLGVDVKQKIMGSIVQEAEDFELNG